MKHTPNFFWPAAVCAALALPIIRPAAAQNRVIATGLTNIAASASGGRILSISSTLDNDKEYGAGNLIDGQNYDPKQPTSSKGWVSDKFDPINMDYVTLGFEGNKIQKIGKIVLNPTAAVTPERWAKDVEVQVSTDSAEGPYTPVAQLTLRRLPQPQEFSMLPVDARFVRLMFRSNWGSDRAVALGEVEIYEAIDTNNPLGQLIVRLEGAVRELELYRKTQIESNNGGGQIVTRTSARPMSEATVQLIQMVGGSDANRYPVSGLNIALSTNGGKVAAYSTVFDNDPTFGPDKLIDGENYVAGSDKGSFGWASEGFTPGKQFVTLGFKEDRTKLIGKIVMNPASAQSDLRWARRVDVQVTSGDAVNGPYRSVATINLQPTATNQEFILRPVEAKYVRFVFLANGPGIVLPNADPNINSDRAVSLGEIEVYEATSTGDQLEALIGRFKQVLLDMKNLQQREENGVAPKPAAAALKGKLAPQKVVPKTKIAAPKRRSQATFAENERENAG